MDTGAIDNNYMIESKSNSSETDYQCHTPCPQSPQGKKHTNFTDIQPTQTQHTHKVIDIRHTIRSFHINSPSNDFSISRHKLQATAGHKILWKFYTFMQWGYLYGLCNTWAI